MERWGERQGNPLKAAEPPLQVLEVHLPSATDDKALAMSQIHFLMCGKGCKAVVTGWEGCSLNRRTLPITREVTKLKLPRLEGLVEETGNTLRI